ncbi:DUF3800 domain-containing protein [Pseudobutyrivibrio ruminis]|uniref:DUF3800 domain-containing protein n=1 Tax=Pseudobutyrivibrio ruminis DSM 9787 TaxID=1123011 RepID=A0A285RER5_9FIRM|nr:DUF3800 domain-containing protein [Pseudobutyrivibrio ruminis]SOB92570.1 hypothetical protein SAMN02910411_0937 [Pseudobutyrivibrio ruminis DSM 9787]
MDRELSNDLKGNIFQDDLLADLWGVNLEENLHFYYDESNNCRKFWIDSEKGDFNHNPEADFVLAGIACEEELQIPFSELIERFRLQKNVTELKSKSLFKGKDFLGCMEVRYTAALFKLIDDYDLYVHYKHINNFFYTIVEIMDSITDPEEIAEFGFDYFQLKSTLYNMLVPNISAVKEVMIKYHYPSIKKEEIGNFCTALLSTMEIRFNQSPDEKFLSGVLKRASGREELLFIQDEEEYLLQEDFSLFYAEPILKFTKSYHHFDEELSIQEKILDIVNMYSSNLTNYEFVNSKDNTMVQISDLVAGIMGRFFLFINATQSADFRRIIRGLSDVQLVNCCKLNELISKSDMRNKGLLHSITAIGILKKSVLFFEYVSAENKRRLKN